MTSLVKRTGAVCAIMLAFACVKINAQSVDPQFEVATWQGFRKAAISYTFDDECANQVAKAIPMMNELHFQGTFFTVINWGPNWSALQNAADKGHEIASHTVSHPNFGEISDTAQAEEMKNSFDVIRSHITGLHGMTLAYPYCVPGNDSITSTYYFAARGCQGYIEKKTPDDFMNISSIICGDLGAVKTTAEFNNEADTAASRGGWCVYLIHGIDGDGGYSPLSSTVLKEGLQYLDSHRDKFWVGTFGNVARYVRERNCVSVHELGASDSVITVSVSDTLADSIYNYPVTLRRPLPEGWEYASGTQNGKEISTTVAELGGKHYIQFDAIPDNGDVMLKASQAPPVVSAIKNFPAGKEDKLNVRIEHQNLIFTIPDGAENLKEARIYSTNGIPLVNSAIKPLGSPGSGSISLADEALVPGLYILLLSDGNRIWTGKIRILN